jgi:hypothetical protein
MLFVRPECDRACVHSRPTWRLRRTKGENMWWAIGIGGIVYLVLVFTLGLMTLRNGHGWMFFFGIFFPVLWIFGAFMRPPEAAVRGG